MKKPIKAVSVAEGIKELKRQQQEDLESAMLIWDITNRYSSPRITECISGTCPQCTKPFLYRTEIFKVWNYNMKHELPLCSKECVIGAMSVELEKMGCTKPNRTSLGHATISNITRDDIIKLAEKRIGAFNQRALKRYSTIYALLKS